MAKVKPGTVPSPKILGKAAVALGIAPQLAGMPSSMPLGPAGAPVTRLGMEPILSLGDNTLGVQTPPDLNNAPPPPLLSLSAPGTAADASSASYTPAGYPAYTPPGLQPYSSDLPSVPDAPETFPIPNVDFAGNQAAQRQAMDYSKYLPLISLLSGNGLMSGARLLPKVAIGAFTGTKAAQDEAYQNALRNYTLQSQQAQTSFGNQEKLYGDNLERVNTLNQIAQMGNRDAVSSYDKSYDAKIGGYNAGQEQNKLQMLATRNALKDAADIKASDQDAYEKGVAALSKMDEATQKAQIPLMIAKGILPSTWAKDKDGSYQTVGTADPTPKLDRLLAGQRSIIEDMTIKPHSGNVSKAALQSYADAWNNYQHGIDAANGTNTPDKTAEDMDGLWQQSSYEKARIAHWGNQDTNQGRNIDSLISTRSENAQTAKDRLEWQRKKASLIGLNGQIKPDRMIAMQDQVTAGLVSVNKAIGMYQKQIASGMGRDLEGNPIPLTDDRRAEILKSIDDLNDRKQEYLQRQNELYNLGRGGLGQGPRDTSYPFDGAGSRAWIAPATEEASRLGLKVTPHGGARPNQSGTISGDNHKSLHVTDHARDFSGTPQAMAQFFSEMRNNLPKGESELFYSPIGFVKNGKFYSTQDVAANWPNGKALVAAHYSHVHIGGVGPIAGTAEASKTATPAPKPVSQMSRSERIAEFSALVKKAAQ